MTKWLGYPEASEHGGHMVKRVATKPRFEYGCEDCGTRGDAYLFEVGTRGCPARPESLNYLSVDAAPVEDFAARAASQYVRFADKIGMKMGVWSQQAYKVGPEGGKVAEFQNSNGKGYSVYVTEHGKISAVQDAPKRD